MTRKPALLDQLNLVVKDMDAAVAFYRKLGLQIPDPWRNEKGVGHHAEVEMPNGVHLEFDSDALARSYNAGWRELPAAGQAVIGFKLESREAVDALYAELADAGYQGRQEPYDTFWGARLAVVADPDGNDVGLMSPLDPERRTKPPSL